MPFKLYYNNSSYTISDFNGSFLSHTDPILGFIDQWQQGQQTFEVKTSGSTGPPKTISLYRDQLIASAKSTCESLFLKENDSAVLCLNPLNIGGKMMIVRALVQNLILHVVPPSSNPLLNLPSEIDPDFIALVPLQLEEILSSPLSKTRLNTSKAILVGGAAITPELINLSQSIEAPVYSTFGMTETVSHIALKRINGKNPDDSFKVLKDITISTDSENCLQIQGAVTQNEVLQTNDIVELIDPTSFKWLGRKDNVINSGGVKINPEQIEQKISDLIKSTLHCEFIIGGIPDTRYGEIAVLILNHSPLTDEEEDYILSTIKKSCPPYSSPKKIRYTSHFAKTNNGKLLRMEIVNNIRN